MNDSSLPLSTERAAPDYESWGRLWPATREGTVRALLPEATPVQSDRAILAFGNGRSYGDVCLNSEGTLVSTHHLDRILDFDPQTGEVHVESGVLLEDLIRFALPRGWFLPVTPGTQYVTVGGAIANDVHGKNHHAAGTFGCHVPELTLLRSTGELLTCSATENPELYAATIAGLGLTGTIVSCRLRLTAVPGPTFDVESVRYASLDEFVEISNTLDEKYEYSVSWVDCLGGSGTPGRGWYMGGNPSEPAHQQKFKRSSRKLTIPFAPPISPMNRLFLRIFNALYYHRPVPRHQKVDFRPFFYPLDAIGHWNRLYGRRGFFQFQSVVPFEGGTEIIAEMFRTIRAAKDGSFLAVLKRFGTAPSPGIMSFPRPGLTLALDFPNRGPKTRALLARLEEQTMECGGALYPAKDALMTPETFRTSYPRWEQVERLRDPAVNSDFWRRVTGG